MFDWSNNCWTPIKVQSGIALTSFDFKNGCRVIDTQSTPQGFIDKKVCEVSVWSERYYRCNSGTALNSTFRAVQKLVLNDHKQAATDEITVIAITDNALSEIGKILSELAAAAEAAANPNPGLIANENVTLAPPAELASSEAKLSHAIDSLARARENFSPQCPPNPREVDVAAEAAALTRLSILEAAGRAVLLNQK